MCGKTHNKDNNDIQLTRAKTICLKIVDMSTRYDRTIFFKIQSSSAYVQRVMFFCLPVSRLASFNTIVDDDTRLCRSRAEIVHQSQSV